MGAALCAGGIPCGRGAPGAVLAGAERRGYNRPSGAAKKGIHVKIGIIGHGNVGGTLGKGWAKAGHVIKWGVRNPSDPKLATLITEAGANASAGTVSDAVDFGEVVVLTVPANAVQATIKEMGKLSGKILLDATNPMKADFSGLEIGLTTSSAEEIAGLATGARVVKIFNSTGAANMANPKYGDTSLTMLYCGDDAEAKKVVAQLASDLGFDPIDAGGLSRARLLEPLAMLWVNLAFGGMGPNIAFQIIRR